MYLVRKILPIMIALSLFCIVVLVGTYAYSGSVIPITGEGRAKDAVTWVMWIFVVSIPVTTLCLILVQLWKGRT